VRGGAVFPPEFWRLGDSAAIHILSDWRRQALQVHQSLPLCFFSGIVNSFIVRRLLGNIGRLTTLLLGGGDSKRRTKSLEAERAERPRLESSPCRLGQWL